MVRTESFPHPDLSPGMPTTSLFGFACRKRSFPVKILIFVLAVLILWQGSAPAATSKAKRKYLEADDCYKALRHSETKKQKLLEWLKCIGKYEDIYTDFPGSSWAPAGMYKASRLYLKLSELSGDPIYKTRAVDLLARIQKKYRKSAYTRRSKTLLKTVTSDPVTLPIKHLRSKKAQTKNLAIAPKSLKTKEKSPEKAAGKVLPVDPPEEAEVYPDPPKPRKTKGDIQVTDLRFWSNPEYTRIVVNASDERPYTHRLLNKDPKIDKPFQRLYVDIDQARLGSGIASHTPINDNLLNQARAGQYLPHTVRVVVDIKSFENYKIFSLKDPFRIVIDVWGKGSNGAPPQLAHQILEPGKKPIKMSRITTDNLRSSDIARQLALGVNKIVIDPGHGGPDPGAPGAIKGVWEKDIVLKLAKDLAAKLRDRLKCTVVLTRSKDVKLTLEERTAIANTERADLFISLHCNAAKNKRLSGIETYLLNLATDDKAIAVAARENATSRKNISDLEFILSDLMKHAKIEESTRLAHDVHKSMVHGVKKKYSAVKDLGVKQAPFYVLLGARMPSILIETSFISNKKECKRLLTASYRNDICNAITDGIQKYIDATNPREL
ncbi:N-acetylmuramoyl-L-alanine amidase [Desulfospira joergensenii]|uniref:N-acetylmuramoyl-L-alanine amidase n=1 Tax=Desulfospira joergensenii TaxID=53329 RepID=UPI0003B6408C|nr:N-acetylmuramoyl-L-alanine amidase [Desulfospira joergensenii]